MFVFVAIIFSSESWDIYRFNLCRRLNSFSFLPFSTATAKTTAASFFAISCAIVNSRFAVGKGIQYCPYAETENPYVHCHQHCRDYNLVVSPIFFIIGFHFKMYFDRIVRHTVLQKDKFGPYLRANAPISINNS